MIPKAGLAQLRPGLEDVEVDSTILRPATYTERALGNLTHALILGCVVVVIVLVIFLFDWRTAIISMTAIPLSLVATSLVLYWRGGTINTMVLAELVIALGEVVDGAIIDVEDIVRRLRLNALGGNPVSRFAVVLRASLEVRSAVVYASLIVVLVFLPVFVMEGVAGSLFRPRAMSYVLAIMASLLVALTVTPALSLLLVRGRAREHEAPVTRLLKHIYRSLLPPLIARPRWAIGIIVLAFTLAEPFWRTEAAQSDHTHAGLGLTLVTTYAAAIGANLCFEIIGGAFRASLHIPPAHDAKELAPQQATAASRWGEATSSAWFQRCRDHWPQASPAP